MRYEPADDASWLEIDRLIVDRMMIAAIRRTQDSLRIGLGEARSLVEERWEHLLESGTLDLFRVIASIEFDDSPLVRPYVGGAAGDRSFGFEFELFPTARGFGWPAAATDPSGRVFRRGGSHGEVTLGFWDRAIDEHVVAAGVGASFSIRMHSTPVGAGSITAVVGRT